MEIPRLALVALFATALVAGAATSPPAADARFTQNISTEDRAAAGIATASSDELAVLDALVRRDTATRSRVQAQPDVSPRFSERLTADERRLTGIDKLTPEAVLRLDALVERHQSPVLARALLAPPTYVARSRGVESTEKKPEKRISGTFSFSMGWGSGGYSEQTGGMTWNYSDPAGRYSVDAGYSESHVKSGDNLRYYGFPDRYTEKTGAVAVKFTDPNGKYSLSIGVADTQIKDTSR